MNLYWPDRLFGNERAREARRRAKWAEAEREAVKILLLSHAHCLDGVASAIVTLRSRPGVGVCYLQPSQIAQALEFFAQFPCNGRTMLVADLSLQKDQFDSIVHACGSLRANGWHIEWRDHHHKQWEGLPLEELQAHVPVLEVNRDATESGASMQQQALAPDDLFLRRLANTVRDRDLWWNKEPDSETLEFALAQMGTSRFVRTYLAAAPTDPVVLPHVAAAALRERANQEAVLARLLAEARFHGEGQSKVGLVYGKLPKNTGLHELIEDQGCAIAVNVRPNGKVSLRSRKDAAVCHKVAQRFSGGGHPNASGADLGLKGVAYWWYVVRRGRVARVEELVQACLDELGGRAGESLPPVPSARSR